MLCQKNSSQYWDHKISFAIIFYFVASAANSTMKMVLPSLTNYWFLISAFWGIAIIYFFIGVLGEVFRRNSKLLIRSYIIFIFLYGFSYIYATFRGEPTSALLRYSAFLTLAWWIPIGVFSASIYDVKILYRTMYKWSFILSGILLIMFFSHKSNASDYASDYNMYFGFSFVLPTLFHLNEWFEKKKVTLLIIALIEVFIIVIYANRGVLLSVVFFVFARIFIGKQISLTKKLLFAVILSATILILSIYFFEITIKAIGLLESLGLKSRSLGMMLNGTMLSDSSNRDIIWNNSIKLIFEKPLLGWGLGGEFVQLFRMEGGSVIDGSFTPHNSFLQNMVNFGVLGGIFVSILFIKPYLKLNNLSQSDNYSLLLIFSSMVLPCFFTASGLFVKPAAAIMYYLFYHKYNKKTI